VPTRSSDQQRTGLVRYHRFDAGQDRQALVALYPIRGKGGGHTCAAVSDVAAVGVR